MGPVDLRIYLQTLFGNRDKITAGDFSGDELEAIRAAVLANQARTGATTRGSVAYQDYPEAAQAGPGYVPIESTLGRFNYRVLPDGSVRALDRYDFLNDERKADVERYEAMSPTRRAIQAPLTALSQLLSGRPRSAAGELGNAFIGREGRDVDVVIPPRTATRKARGGVVRGANTKGGAVRSPLDTIKECSCHGR